MKKLLLTILLLFVACSVRQPIPPGEIPVQGELTEQEVQDGAQVYNQLSSQYPPDNDLARNRRIREIVTRLSDAAGGINGGNPWHIYLFREDNTKNAAATRGNYIFVWSGILLATKSDDELATILAHEVSHVLAKHTNKTPQEIVGEIVGGSASMVASSALSGNGYGQVAKIGGQLTKMIFDAVLINPESQRIESEADTIGLFLMSKAGYNPNAAVDFWERIKSDPAFSGMALSFLSTHPTSEKRIENLKKYLPEAMQLYKHRRQ